MRTTAIVGDTLSATDIERATYKGIIDFHGTIGKFDWSIHEHHSGCEVRIQTAPGPQNCKTIAKRAKWQNVPQIIADHINKENGK